MRTATEIINDIVAIRQENDYNKFMEYCDTLTLEELTALRQFAAGMLVFAETEIMRKEAINKVLS